MGCQEPGYCSAGPCGFTPASLSTQRAEVMRSSLLLSPAGVSGADGEERWEWRQSRTEARASAKWGQTPCLTSLPGAAETGLECLVSGRWGSRRGLSAPGSQRGGHSCLENALYTEDCLYLEDSLTRHPVFNL